MGRMEKDYFKGLSPYYYYYPHMKEEVEDPNSTLTTSLEASS
jgi:hypothetical protein